MAILDRNKSEKFENLAVMSKQANQSSGNSKMEQSSEIKILNSMHSFKTVSELKNENKGDYIQVLIKVPKLQNQNCCRDNIELALYSTTNLEEPHVHLLHVTPMMKNPTKELQKESYYVNLKYQNGTYVLDTSNHHYLPKTGTLIGAKFWNEETREFVLGKEGLRLSIVKPVGKGAPEEHEMRQVFLYSGIGDENDIDSGRVYLGMKLTTGMNQGVISSDLIKDKKIYNFGIKKIKAVTEIFGEDDIPQKIQFILDGGTLKKREMAVFLEHLDILDEPTKGTIISDRMVEFTTSLPLSNVQPSLLKLTVTSQKASGNWFIDLVPSEVCKKKLKKRNTVAASEPIWSRKSARFDDSDMQSVLNNSKREAYRNNPDFLDLRMDFVEASEHNDLKEKHDAVVIENKELRNENDMLRNEIHELQKRLKNESYHSVTASDVVKQSTNNQIIQASRFTRKI